jgi:hypothetical protein
MKASNMYDKTNPKESGKKSMVSPNPKKVMNPKTYHGEAENLSQDYPTKPIPNQNHEGFQFGTNPDKASAFEKNLIMLEKKEREMARNKYIKGIQGRDGGACYDENY